MCQHHYGCVQAAVCGCAFAEVDHADEELQQLVDGARAHGVRVGALVDIIPTVRKSAYAHGGPVTAVVMHDGGSWDNCSSVHLWANAPS